MTDKRTIQIVALALALVVVGAVAGSIVLAGMDRTAPDLVADLAKIALGALAALLASTRASDTPAPVTVVNEPSTDPVPVQEVAKPKRTVRK